MNKEQYKDKKVIFITSGVGGPYPPLEEGIVNSLTKFVQLKVCHPSQDLVVETKMYKPDIVLVFQEFFINHSQMKEIKQLGTPIAIWTTDDPYYTDATKEFGYFDYVFTVELACVDFYRKLGCPNSINLPLGCFTNIFYPQTVKKEEEVDICFVGSGFPNRLEIFDKMADYLKDKNVIITGQWWESLKNYDLLKSKIDHKNYWIPPQETAYYYNRAKIVLNFHRLPSYDYPIEGQSNSENIPALSVNNRTFEINGCKTLQITDLREDLKNQYEIGKEIETFSSTQELIYKIEYYLNNEKERAAIAENGYQRTIDYHLYENRVYKLLDTVFRVS